MMFVEAERWAGECDARLRDKGEASALSPIFGIPCSVKDWWLLSRVRQSRAVAVRIHIVSVQATTVPSGSPNSFISPWLTIVRMYACCAPPARAFAHTTIYRTYLSGIASNPIYGETTHAHSQTLCAGGSSSGEGAAFYRCAWICVGTGTDVGGSIPCRHILMVSLVSGPLRFA